MSHASEFPASAHRVATFDIGPPVWDRWQVPFADLATFLDTVRGKEMPEPLRYKDDAKFLATGVSVEYHGWDRIAQTWASGLVTIHYAEPLKPIPS